MCGALLERRISLLLCFDVGVQHTGPLVSDEAMQRNAGAERRIYELLIDGTGTGRFVLGLGVSHIPLVRQIRGHSYWKPVASMRACLDGWNGLPPVQFLPL
jgi:hypothetical protein